MGEAVVAALVGALSALVVNFLIQRATNFRFEAELKSKYELASLDKRLQAHQEAYALWWKLKQNLHTNELWDVTLECRTWWVNNNLYLHKRARKAFWEAFLGAEFRQEDLEYSRHDPLFRIDAMESIKENFRKIHIAGEAIEESIGYLHRDPSLPTDDEGEE